MIAASDLVPNHQVRHPPETPHEIHVECEEVHEPHADFADADALRREIADLRATLTQAKTSHQDQQLSDDLERRKLTCDVVASEKRIATLLRDMNDTAAMEGYAALVVRRATPQQQGGEVIDSTAHVLRLQHRIEKVTGEAIDFQDELALVPHSGDAMMQDLRDIFNNKATHTAGTSSKQGDDVDYRTELFNANGAIRRSFRNLVAPNKDHAENVKTAPSQQADINALQQTAADLRSNLQAVCARHESEQRSSELRLNKLRRSKVEADKRVATLTLRLNDEFDVSQYATLIQEADASSRPVDSTCYLLQLQAKLAKAMHQRGILKNQVLLARQAGSLMRRELIRMVEDSSHKCCQGQEGGEEPEAADYCHQLKGGDFAMQDRLRSARNMVVD